MKKLVLILLIIMTSKIGFGQKILNQKDDTYYSPKEDYWKFSEQLFSFLSTKSSPKSSTTFHLKSHFYKANSNRSGTEFLHTGPYQEIKYKVKVKSNKSHKIKLDTVSSQFMWRIWNCHDNNMEIENSKKIQNSKLNIKYYLISFDANKRKKKESYEVNYDDTQMIIKITCVKNFKLYRNDLRSEPFIVRIFDVVNYYDNKYGCMEIVNTN